MSFANLLSIDRPINNSSSYSFANYNILMLHIGHGHLYVSFVWGLGILHVKNGFCRVVGAYINISDCGVSKKKNSNGSNKI